MTFVLLLRYWREGLIGVLVVALIGSCVSRDHRIAAKAVAKEQNRQADETLKVVAPARVKADSDLTKTLAAAKKALAKTDTVERWRTDTLYLPGDTTKRIAVPVAEVARSDTAQKTCNELTLSCAAYRDWADREIAAWKVKANAGPILVTRSCVAPSVTVGIVGAAIGYLVHRP